MEDQELQKQINDSIQKDLENHRNDIKELFKHAEIANKEMGSVDKRLAIVETNVSWIKDTVKNVDSRAWWILGTVVIGITTQILITLLK